MNLRVRVVRTVVVALAAVAVLALPRQAAAAPYLNGIFQATITDEGSAPAAFTLAAGVPFPQATFPDEFIGVDTQVSAITGLQADLLIGVGEIVQGAVDGRMRFALLYPTSLNPEVAFIVGSFTLNFESDTAGPYEASGVVVGDQYSIYLSGNDGKGTPETGDDKPFLLRANGVFTGAFGVGDQVFGDVQILVGEPVLRVAGGALAASRSEIGVNADLAAITGPNPFTFTRIVPADGAGDLSVDAGTTAAFSSGAKYGGNLTGLPGPAGSVDFDIKALVLTSGSSAWNGISFGRFSWVGTDGTMTQGFMVGNVDAPDPSGVPLEGRMFSLVSTRSGSADHYAGTYQGHLTTTTDPEDSAQLTLAGGIWEVDPAPPEVVAVDSGQWLVGALEHPTTYTRDLNGWKNQKTVQFLLGSSRTKPKLLMRYDAARNRFQLFNSATRSWTAACAPGSSKVLRVRQAQLSCAESSADGSGEFLQVVWAVKPTKSLVGQWNAYVQVVDRSKLSTGWRQQDPIEVLTAP